MSPESQVFGDEAAPPGARLWLEGPGRVLSPRDSLPIRVLGTKAASDEAPRASGAGPRSVSQALGPSRTQVFVPWADRLRT